VSPKAPLKPCTTPGCPELVAHGKCKAHARATDHERPNSATRGYDATWRKLRAQVLIERPWCEQPGCYKPATDVHHITRRRDGGPDERTNLMSLCHQHHSAITLAETRGQVTNSPPLRNTHAEESSAGYTLP
jgi:5-methylcytosine-specific restriction protein A